MTKADVLRSVTTNNYSRVERWPLTIPGPLQIQPRRNLSRMWHEARSFHACRSTTQRLMSPEETGGASGWALVVRSGRRHRRSSGKLPEIRTCSHRQPPRLSCRGQSEARTVRLHHPNTRSLPQIRPPGADRPREAPFEGRSAPARRPVGRQFVARAHEHAAVTGLIWCRSSRMASPAAVVPARIDCARPTSPDLFNKI
jgi:hypothetical protein